MKAFATVDDLAAGWPDYDRSLDAVSGTLLERASARLSALLDRHGVEIDEEDDVQATNLKSVTCNMVRRSLNGPSADGVASIAQGIGSTNVSVSYRDPDGSFYLSRSDRELLGISGRGGFRMLRPSIRNADGTPAEGW